MKETRVMMDMPITIEIIGSLVTSKVIDQVFDYFTFIDHKFSVFRPDSEISLINHGKIKAADYSLEMKTVLELCETTKQQSHGYFDIYRQGIIDPSGLVKGWAIYQAAQIVTKLGFTNYYLDVGGDVQISGHNDQGEPWLVGICNPFNTSQIVKALKLSNQGIATSGTYIRGQHVYNPKKQNHLITDIVSLTVIGPNVYEADRFATAAFAMGKEGINFIQSLPGFEGYQIDHQGIATYTTGFNNFVINHV